MKKIALYLSAFASLFIFLTGCQKSDDLIDNFRVVKVFDDPFASVNNLDAKIAAGVNRIYMSYGRGGWETTPIGNISVVGYSHEYSVNIMATDNSGNLLWRTPMPKADINICDLLELNDGNCLVVAKDNSIWYNNTIYFFSFDRNGQLVSRDSTIFPGSITSNFYISINSLNALKAANGNIIVYGNYRDNSDLAFACEYTPNGILQWANSHYHFPMAPDFGNQQAFFSGCTPTPDGGYLFLGSANSDSWASPVNYQITLFKTNSSGDSLWSKSFRHDELNWNPTGNIIALPNGNYRFYFTSGITRSVMNIYEINSNGDSVNATAVDILEQNKGTVILPENDGGSFALMNIYGSMINSGGGDAVFYQTNTMYLNFDPGLRIINKNKFQTETTDFITTACKTSDGTTACFGMIQSYNKNYYQPELIIMK